MEFIDKHYKLIKIMYVIFIFMIIHIFNASIFRPDTFSTPFLIYSTANFILIFLSYLVLDKIWSLKVELVFKSIVFIVVMVILYHSVFLIYIYGIEILGKIYPDESWFSRIIERYKSFAFFDYYRKEKFSLMSGFFYFPLLILSIGGFVDRYTSAIKKTGELQSLNSELELDVLKSQIEPHFLFNTLNNIYSLVIDNDKAVDTILKLSDLLRFSLYESSSKSISLMDEIRFLKGYIELEKSQLNKGVEIQYDFSSVENQLYQVSPLLFINFVENAFKYGANCKIDGNFVIITLMQSGDEVIFTACNKTTLINQKGERLVGKGIENARRRLELLYPNSHELVITEENGVFIVKLRISTLGDLN